jgi:nucleoside-diphosphate-sugar epimerase
MFAEAADRGVKTLILRAGDFFGGDGRGSWFDTVIVRAIERGKVTYPGPDDAIHAWAYLPDLSHAFVSLADKAGSLSNFEMFNFAGHSVTGRELHAAIEQAMERPLAAAGFPWPLIRAGGLFYPMWREIAEMAYLWKRPHRLKGDKLEKLVGPLPATPLEEAVSKALDDLQLRRSRKLFNPRSLPTFAA